MYNLQLDGGAAPSTDPPATASRPTITGLEVPKVLAVYDAT